MFKGEFDYRRVFSHFLRVQPVPTGLVLATALLLPFDPPVGAGEIVVIDEDRGATFGGLVDGFPGLFPFDGVPDVPDRLGVGFKAGITQEHGIMRARTADGAGSYGSSSICKPRIVAAGDCAAEGDR